MEFPYRVVVNKPKGYNLSLVSTVQNTVIQKKSNIVVRIGGNGVPLIASNLQKIYQVDSFTGDGLTTSFALTKTLGFIIAVTYNGQEIDEGSDSETYSISGNDVVFGFTPDAFKIKVKYFYAT